MRRAIVAVALGAVACVLAVGGPATAGPTPTQKCAAKKIKAACKKASCVLGIDLKGGTDFSKCTGGLSKAFIKLESKPGCGTSGDVAAIEAKVDAFATDIVSELKPVTDKCEAAKIRAAAKKVCCELGADGKAIVKGGTADTTKCTKSFAAIFMKLETKGGCATSGDTTTIENKVDAFVDDVVDEVSNETTTTSTSTTTSTTSTTACGNTPTGLVVKGSLTPTFGRFNYNSTIGLPGASSACSSSFPGSHPCTLADLQGAPATDLACLRDTASTPVTSFWAIDPMAAPLSQCNDDVSSHLNWEYATAHTASRGQRVMLDNATGTLGPPLTGLQCNAATNWVACCQ